MWFLTESEEGREHARAAWRVREAYNMPLDLWELRMGPGSFSPMQRFMLEAGYKVGTGVCRGLQGAAWGGGREEGADQEKGLEAGGEGYSWPGCEGGCGWGTRGQ